MLNAYSFAIVYATLGEKDKAFEQLELGYSQRYQDKLSLKTDPRPDSLRDDPRFQELLKKVGFPQ